MLTTNSQEEDEEQKVHYEQIDEKNYDEEEEKEESNDDVDNESDAEEKINANKEKEDTEEHESKDESMSHNEEEGKQQDRKINEEDEDKDESISENQVEEQEEEEAEEDEEKGGKSPPISLSVDNRSPTVQKSNPTNRIDEAFHSESESDCPSSKPLQKPAVKHPAETKHNEILEPQRKKKKVKNGHQENGSAEEKISVFSRFWNKDDEIAILKGMVEYKSSNGDSPYADMGAFHDFIKESLHIDPSRKQITDKISRLRKKYWKNAEKCKNLVFSKPHEHKSFELSKKIWGGVYEASGEVFLSMYPKLNESLQWKTICYRSLGGTS